LDQDGDLDAVFANMPTQSEIWMNDGSGHFFNSYQRLGDSAHGVGIGDLDGDGDLDLLITRASSSVPTRVYFNNGLGLFTAANEDLGDTSRSGNFVSLFDLEGDGDLDAGIYYSDRSSRVYINDGSGQFNPLGTQIPGLPAWGDLDGDGDVDAVAQQFSGGYLVLLSVGNNLFEEAASVNAPHSFIPGGMELGDIDNDGDLDLVSANGGFSLESPLALLINDGTGHFTSASEPRFRVGMARVTLGDFNGDGTLDVFLGCHENVNVIGVNDGNGGYIDSGLRLGLAEMEGVSGIGDLDGDGDLDLFVAIYGQGGPNQVWLNTTE